MRKIFLFLVYLTICNTLFAQVAKTVELDADIHAMEFVKNNQQWDDNKIQYRADIPSGYMFLYKNAIQYSFYDQETLRQLHPNTNQALASKVAQEGLKAHSVVASFVGSNEQVKISGEQSSPTKRNYYLGKNTQKWASNVPAYHSLFYDEVYNGVDLRFYTKEHHFKYEFIVAPNGNTSQIKIEYKHAKSVELVNGNLVVQTTLNSFTERKPYTYQYIDGKEVVVHSAFVLKDNVVSFEFPNGYNKNYPLIIDPELVFSTYSGGTSDNWGNTACFDDNGRLYSGAATFGTNFPNFTGAFTVGLLGGNNDIGIFRYNATGTTLEYLTFIGGSGIETPHSLVVDDANNLLILGSTGSTNFPTSNATTYNGGTFISFANSLYGASYGNGTDIFITKLQADGTLFASTLIGGTGNDGIHVDLNETTIHNYGDDFRGDILTDDIGNIYVASTTRSNTITGFTGSRSGNQDAIIFSLDANLSLLWGNYFGGTATDIGLSIKRNNAGQIFMGGGTRSTNLPLTTGSLQATSSGNDEGFIARYSSTGTLERVTYLGTNAADMVFFLDIDNSNNVYAFGQTFGAYPVSMGVYSDPNSGQFIHKLSGDLITNRWSTVVGSGDGAPDISPTAFLVVTENDCNNIYITGWGGNINQGVNGTTNSSIEVSGLPTTPDAFRGTSNNGSDFYIAVFRRDMADFVYGTFFGESSSGERGDHVDGGTCRFSPNGTVYHAVCASCGSTNGFPTTPGAWSSNNNSTNCNNAVFKFSVDLEAAFDLQDPTNGFAVIGEGETVCSSTINFNYNGLGAETFVWDLFDSNNNKIFTQGSTQDFEYTFESAGTYRVQLTVINFSSCALVDRASQTVNIIIPNFGISEDKTICAGTSTQLSATGATTYKWTPETGLNNPNVASPVATPSQTTTYSVEMVDSRGCETTKQVTITIAEDPAFDYTFDLAKSCNTPLTGSFKIIVDTAAVDISKFNFRWNINGEILAGLDPQYQFPENNNEEPQEYVITLTVTDEFGCQYTNQKTVSVPQNQATLGNVITPNGDGLNDKFVVFEANSKVEIFNRWGKRLYQSDNYKNDWGGDIDNGTYFYSVTSPDGTECKGWIQILK